jgi:RNA 2',3'-cyclic 3'-phosphodiesterase
VSGAARARLFVALDLPEDVREALAAWGRAVAAPDGAERRLRLVPADALHVTLCFLGWRDEGQAEEIATLALGAVSEGAPAPDLAVGAGVWLPPRRPRVLAVDLADEDGALAGLQARVSDALAARVAFVPEKRPFRPHVTVARVPRGVRAGGREEPAPPAPLRFPGAAVTLYRSRLSGAGAQYEPLARTELGER